jgi:hypothetical protein
VADEEHVTVMAYPTQPAAGEPDRKAAVQELIEDLDGMSASASHVPDDEMDALIDEAIRHIRHRGTASLDRFTIRSRRGGARPLPTHASSLAGG